MGERLQNENGHDIGYRDADGNVFDRNGKATGLRFVDTCLPGGFGTLLNSSGRTCGKARRVSGYHTPISRARLDSSPLNTYSPFHNYNGQGGNN